MDNKKELLNRLEKLVGSREMAFEICGLFEEWEEKKKQTRLEKQKEGIRKAREKGVALGRPKIEEPDNFPAIMAAWEKKRINAAEAAQMCGIGVSTFYRRVRDVKNTAKREGGEGNEADKE